MSNTFIPEITTPLRQKMVKVPEVIQYASGIKVYGKLIKSLVFSTDIAVIRNTNANAVMAVYPFTPQPVITHALMMASDIPVFCGVGGGLTQGKRVVNLALDAEFEGAMAVVVNAPTANDIIKRMRNTIDIPIVVTIVSEHEDIRGRIEAGATILNISGAKKTPKIVRNVKEICPSIPIIATGGPTDESIMETIEAGANAISYTPPTNAEIFSEVMRKYRSEKE
ncbi:hydrolase [Aceticella autotrophica]|uniref:Hydrolase n=1 Tax=Aceticella autotrophica TaxID=2755338 RepID=A0A975GAI8_9THEO|nr:hydrolase [Aceticella autotrophica]QSZ27504.1 hydrolase [Aceticella autotrophica]